MDTGFNDALTLPLDTIRRLGLTPEGRRPAFLANGGEVMLRGWSGTAVWQGVRRSIVVLQAEGDPLLGMGLLRGNRITLDALEGGRGAYRGTSDIT